MKFAFKWYKIKKIFFSCRQRSGENDTTPFYKNEPANASKKDQTEMYADLQYTDDISAYQTLARGNDAVYTNSLNL